MATATDLTRQQLDELDALLQRMLNPNAKPEPAVPAPAGWRLDPPAPVAAPHLNLAAFMPEPPAPVEDVIEVVAPTPLMAVTPPEPSPVSEFEMATLTPIAPAVQGPSIALWPLIAVNWLLEAFLKMFGPPGEALTGRAGKNALGYAGLLMLIGAAVWAVK